MSYNSLTQYYLDDFEFVKRVAASDMRVIDMLRFKQTGKLFLSITYIKFYVIESQMHKFLQRLELISRFSHPAVAKIFGYILPKHEKKCPSILISSLKRGNLAKYIEDSVLRTKKTKLDTSTIFKIIIGVASFLKYIHSIGIVHGDLQPTSIFLNENFEPILLPGVASRSPYYKNAGQTCEFSTELISSPEILSGELKKPNFESDVYAFGVLVFRFCSNKMLFNQSDISLSFKDNILQGRRFIIPSFTYIFLKETIENCWAQNPANRPNMKDVFTKLNRDIPIFLHENITDDYKQYVSRLCDVTDLSITESSDYSYSSAENTLFLTGKSTEVFDIDKLKKSDAYKFIKSHHLLSIKQKYEFIHILKLQITLVEINSTNFDKSFNWIYKNIKWNNMKQIDLFIRTLFIATQVRWKNLSTIANLFKKISMKTESNTNQIKDIFVSMLFKEMSYYEPFPKMTSVVSLLRQLTDCRLYQPSYIVDTIYNFYKSDTSPKRNSCLIFAWFADYIYNHNQTAYKEICQEFEKHTNNPYFPMAYQDFYTDLKTEYEKDWSQYVMCLNNVQGTRGIKTEIIHDDIVNFRNRRMEDITSHGKFKPDIFESCYALAYKPNATMYSAAYASMRIFSRMIQSVNFQASRDERGFRPTHFVGVGGSEAIYNIVAPQIGSSNDVLIGALAFHQHLIEMKQFAREKFEPSRPDMFGNHMLIAAATSNNLFGVINLILKHVDPLVEEIFNKTALHAAAENGQLEVLSFMLLTCPESVNSQNTFGQTALHMAIEHSRNSCAMKLIKCESINLNMQDDDGYTPLIYAIMQKDVDIVKKILSKENCNVNIKAKNGMTALHFAAKNYNADIIALLLKRNDINTEIMDKKDRKAIDLLNETQKQEFIHIMSQDKTIDNANNCRIC